MSGLTQIIRNLFIRLEGFFSVVFRTVFNFLGNLFGFFGRLFGFSNSGYFLEADQQQSIKRETTQQSVSTEASKASQTPTTSRRPNPQMDYYRKMAQEVKKS
ncbi:threonine dehydratase [Brasilonema sp. UFV-L1]|uniref:threonine dehydratase n=1 Tax=Brasilonema sp. UFV-L1 TaxID=2234130 RepID=UPI00145E8CE6|nr:threonine dehydratase [Brasilonema sp. UFV-L1]NMG06834.1 threonine dehydratase [Brasilonema sp. UFV-L1]